MLQFVFLLLQLRLVTTRGLPFNCIGESWYEIHNTKYDIFQYQRKKLSCLKPITVVKGKKNHFVLFLYCEWGRPTIVTRMNNEDSHIPSKAGLFKL